MGTPLFQVDAFATGPFSGNPAAVCVLERPADPAWMQSVAAEMNLSETAFVHPLHGDDAGRFGLRWFTPTVEVDLCGHATLASAHVLWDTRRLPAETAARFETRSGVLHASQTGDEVTLDLPADPVTPAEPDPGLLEAVGIADAVASRGRIGWVLEVADADAVRCARPDFPRLAAFDIAVLTAPADDPEFDFVSRSFGPKFGIDEDPVTGSSHCALGPYWGDQLGKTEMTGFQASARGGVVRVRVDGDRAVLGGRAVTITRGELLA
ncbi:MAG TPA: PhzF family phenazine biosynthesis protein [Acidimicrobiia bacterium]|nr:PhzF family phenazine biosynthesis protein [Acidimicrobiia bacterium]